MSETHQCTICRGLRPNNGVVCLGCGTALLKCSQRKAKRHTTECPGCTHTGPHQTLEAGRYRCLKCTAIFEHGDVGYLDDRPDINAEKLERMAVERRKRGAYR